MVTNAFSSLDASGHLAPGLARDQVVRELTQIGLEPHPDLVDWFSLHNGGWLPHLKLQLLSLQEAIDHRIDLSTDFAVPYRSSWFPFLTDSTESFMLDTATGAVMFFDLASGDDEARELAPTLALWISERTGGATPASNTSGDSESAERGGDTTKPIAIPTLDEIKDGSQRALRGLADLARNAAEWIDDKERELGNWDPASKQAPAAPSSPPESTTANTPAQAAPSPSVPTSSPTRVAKVTQASQWRPGASAIDYLATSAVTGQVIAVSNQRDQAVVHILQTSTGFSLQHTLHIPEPVFRVGLSPCPSAPTILINGAWLSNLADGTTTRIDVLAERSDREWAWPSNPTRMWAASGRAVLVGRRGSRSEPDQAWAYLLDAESGQARKLGESPTLHGDYVVYGLSGAGDQDLRIEHLDGTAHMRITPKDVGFEVQAKHGYRGFSSTTLLSGNGQVLVAHSHRWGAGFAIVNLATKQVSVHSGLVARAISHDGSLIFAVKSSYPTSECFIINAATGAVEAFGTPEPEDGRVAFSEDGMRLTHHVAKPGPEFMMEHIDWTRGTSSTLSMRSNSPADHAGPIHMRDDAVLFLDKSNTGVSYFASALTEGQLQPAVDLGDAVAASYELRISPDQTTVAWSTRQGIRWTGGAAAPLFRLDTARPVHDHEWALLRSNQVVVSHGDHLELSS